MYRTKMGLIAFVLFYLLGVFGVAGGYLSSEWDSDWSFDDQLFERAPQGV